MRYLSVKEISKIWKLSERTIRNYCKLGKIDGAFLTGKTWNIPSDAKIPNEKNKNIKNNLLKRLREEKSMRLKGGIYHKVQIELTYNSNHIEGSKLSEEQTRLIFETKTIGETKEYIKIDDIVETSNHFKCIDYIIDEVFLPLSENFIKNLHYLLKNNTTDSEKEWFNVGDYKKIPNEVGGKETTLPENVESEMNNLILNYNKKKEKTLEDVVEFHQLFESIHPFQDGNGRVGRLIMFKECLANNIVPFIIDDEHKIYYYRGLSEWKNEKGYLIETCLSCQDKFKKYLEYFRIEI